MNTSFGVLRELFGNDDEVILELLKEMRRNAPNHKENCLRAFKEQNLEDISFLVHKLALTVYYLGFPKAKDACKNIELTIKKQKSLVGLEEDITLLKGILVDLEETVNHQIVFLSEHKE